MRYALGFGCLTTATLASLGIPATVRGAIETLEGGEGPGALGTAAATIVALALANAVARLGSRLALIGAAQGIETELRGDLFVALTRRPPRFFEHHPVGELMARATSDLAGCARSWGSAP